MRQYPNRYPQLKKMDSKSIYIFYQHYSKNIEWEMHGDSEWIYLGAEEDFKEEIAIELVKIFFTENELYLITDRHTSSLIEKNEAIGKVKELFAEYDPALTNAGFNKMMEFNKIGIVRKGLRKHLA